MANGYGKTGDMTQGQKDALTCVGAFVLLLALIIISPIINGFVGMTLWNWFLPEHFGVRPLTLPLAIAVALIVAQFSGTNRISKKSDKDEKWYAQLFAHWVFVPVFVLGMGWIVKQFV
jgi:hypothetical protein